MRYLKFGLFCLCFLSMGSLCKRQASEDAKLKDMTSAAVTTAPVHERLETKPSDKITGQFRVLLDDGIFHGEIASFHDDKVIFEYVERGEEDPGASNVELDLKGNVIDSNGELARPLLVYLRVPGGKFPCNNNFRPSAEVKLCEQFIFEIDDVFRERLVKDLTFREKLSQQIGKDMTVDSKNPYLKVGDIL